MKKLAKVLNLVGLVALLAGCDQIDAGQRGVKTIWGEVQEEVLTEGLYFYNPISSSIHTVDCKTLKSTYTMGAYTKDVQQADLVISVLYNVNPNEAHTLYKEVGLGYADTVITPIVVSASKNVIGRWIAADLVANRDKASKEIYAEIKEDLSAKHIIVTDVTFDSVDYSKVFEQAIEEKQIAEQEAIKAKNKTVQVEEESKQKILMAEAEAKAMKIQTEALSKNTALVAYEAVKKWDGKLPVNIYGSMPVPFVNAIKGK